MQRVTWAHIDGLCISGDKVKGACATSHSGYPNAFVNLKIVEFDSVPVRDYRKDVLLAAAFSGYITAKGWLATTSHMWPQKIKNEK